MTRRLSGLSDWMSHCCPGKTPGGVQPAVTCRGSSMHTAMATGGDRQPACGVAKCAPEHHSKTGGREED